MQNNNLKVQAANKVSLTWGTELIRLQDMLQAFDQGMIFQIINIVF